MLALVGAVYAAPYGGSFDGNKGGMGHGGEPGGDWGKSEGGHMPPKVSDSSQAPLISMLISNSLVTR